MIITQQKAFLPSYLNEAFAFERQIKQWSRAKKEALIAGNIAQIKYLSKK